MENPIFRVYVGQTEVVMRELSNKGFNEITIANNSVRQLLNEIVLDAKHMKLKKTYEKTNRHVSVGVAVRLNGKKIYVTIVHVGTSADWDPNGGKGLDHIAYSQIHEVAKAFATFIGGRVVFRWIKPRRWGSGSIMPSRRDPQIARSGASHSMRPEAVPEIHTDDLLLLPTSVGVIRNSIVEIQTSEIEVLARPFPPPTRGRPARDRSIDDWHTYSWPALVHEHSCGIERSEELAKCADLDAAAELPLDLSLPPGLEATTSCGSWLWPSRPGRLLPHHSDISFN